MVQSCRVEEGGTPACRLAGSCRNVEIRGKSLSSIIISKELNRPHAERDELDREYDLMVILESPSRYEDVVGDIGFHDNYEKLISFTKKAGFSPEKVFVTFLARCSPPKRKPTVQEIKACTPLIFEEIKQVNPTVVMTLGSVPLRLFSLHSKGGINSIRGNLFKKHILIDPEKREWNIIPSFDLGYFKFVADPKIEARALEDYRKAYQFCKKGNIDESTYEAGYKLVDSIADVEDLCKNLEKNKFFSFDTESRGLPWSREPLICFSFCWDYKEGETNCAVLPIYQHDPNGLDWKLKKFWNKEDFEKVKLLLKNVFENPSIAKAAHNAKYDINTIRKHLGIRVKGFIFDSMLMHHALQEKKPHSLEYLADLEFGVGDYSSELHEITGRGKILKNTYDHIPDDILWKYAANDAECCWRLSKLYFNELKSKPHLWKLYCEEIEPLTYTLADAEWFGHYIDKDKLNILNKQYTKEQTELLGKMQTQAWPNFNPMSPNHVRQALINMGFGDRIRDQKKINGYNTSREVLLEIKDDAPLADYILKYRTVTKILGTYLENVEKDLDEDGRVRYFWMIHGTESARLSCRFYHQLPRVDENKKHNLRDMLAASPGNLLVYFDYSQIELRVLAILAEDKEMIRLFDEEGEDIHTTTTALLLGIPEEEVSQFNRQLGKAVNFGLAYGSEGYRLVQTGVWQDKNGVERPVTWEMFNRGMARFKEKFHGVTSYLESVPNIARRNRGIYVTPFGRERRMGDRLNEREEGLRKAAEREIVNFSIQSTASAITVRTLNIIDSWINEWRNKIQDSDIHLVNTVHDSGVWEVNEKYVDFFKKSLKKAAERKIPELNNKSFPCDIGIGRNWSEAEANSKGK